MNEARARSIRVVSAVLLLAGGLIHLWLHLDGYATVGIGRTFVANAAASALAAAYIVLRTDNLGPVSGIAVSVGSLLGLGLTRVGDGLLGFRETGLNPSPEAPLTVLIELLAAALLIVLLVVNQKRRSSTGASDKSRRPNRPLVADRLPGERLRGDRES